MESEEGKLDSAKIFKLFKDLMTRYFDYQSLFFLNVPMLMLFKVSTLMEELVDYSIPIISLVLLLLF